MASGAEHLAPGLHEYLISHSTAPDALLRDLIDFANRSSVVVYTFDTKGMRSMSTQALNAARAKLVQL